MEWLSHWRCRRSAEAVSRIVWARTASAASHQRQSRRAFCHFIGTTGRLEDNWHQAFPLVVRSWCSWVRWPGLLQRGTYVGLRGGWLFVGADAFPNSLVLFWAGLVTNTTFWCWQQMNNEFESRQIIDQKKQKCFSRQTLFSVEQEETDSVEGGWYVWQVVCWPRWRSSGWEGMGGSGRRWTGVGWWELAWRVLRASLISASSRAAWKQIQYQHSI